MLIFKFAFRYYFLILLLSPLISAQVLIDKKIFELGKSNHEFNETEINFYNNEGVEVELNIPLHLSKQKSKNLKLILYLLPNGNSIEWTKGKKLNEEDDWHFDIQHVAAQMRFIRENDTANNYVVCYLKSEYQSWPMWRREKSDADQKIFKLVEELKNLFDEYDVTVSLLSHSGGGSFVFGFINSKEIIPDYVERIIFFDSNYGYADSLRHGEKIASWLSNNKNHKLLVFAYDDRNVKIDGKNIVSPTGGTYYRSLMMRNKMFDNYEIISQFDNEFSIYHDTENRFIFYLKENPENKIFHTVLVELNGVIHGLFWESQHSELNYKFWGERAYGNFVSN